MTEEIKSELEINKKSKMHVKGAHRLADNAAREHALMMRAYRVE